MNQTIPGGWVGWCRPPLRCPRCMEALPPECEPLSGLERFGCRCPSCRALVRFVREDILPPGRGHSYPDIWVPMLLEDRRSRVSPRVLWEPCASAWQSLGGGSGRTFGIADPTATLCEYPRRGEHVRIERRWECEIGVDALLSATYAHGELWVVSALGDVSVLRELRTEPGPEGAPAAARERKRLGANLAQVRDPPAVRGAWWLFLGDAGRATFVYRHPRVTRAGDWAELLVKLPPEWLWRGAPFAVDRAGRAPLFAGLAESQDSGKIAIFVFTVPEEPGMDATLPPPACVEVPGAVNVPVQVPLEYARAEDTARGVHAGKLVWVDHAGSVHLIATMGPPVEWCSVLLLTATGSGSVETAEPSGGLPTRGVLPPLPPLPRALPPPLPSLPPLPVQPRAPSAPASPERLATVPGMPPSALSLPPVHGMAPPRRLAAFFEDQLCVTLEPFVADYAAAGSGGVRVWSIQRQEFDEKEVSVKVFCLEGGPLAERSWVSLPKGPALRSAQELDGKGAVAISALPVYMPPPGTDVGRLAAERAQVLVVSSHNTVDVYSRGDLTRRLNIPSTALLDSDSLAGVPLVTPFGVVVPWEARLEVWTYDRLGEALGDHIPGGAWRRDSLATGAPPATEAPLALRSSTRGGGSRIYPAMIGNRVWLPSDSGRLFCIDLLPERFLVAEVQDSRGSEPQ